MHNRITTPRAPSKTPRAHQTQRRNPTEHSQDLQTEERVEVDSTDPTTGNPQPTLGDNNAYITSAAHHQNLITPHKRSLAEQQLGPKVCTKVAASTCTRVEAGCKQPLAQRRQGAEIATLHRNSPASTPSPYPTPALHRTLRRRHLRTRHRRYTDRCTGAAPNSAQVSCTSEAHNDSKLHLRSPQRTCTEVSTSVGLLLRVDPGIRKDTGRVCAKPSRLVSQVSKP